MLLIMFMTLFADRVRAQNLLGGNVTSLLAGDFEAFEDYEDDPKKLVNEDVQFKELKQVRTKCFHGEITSASSGEIVRINFPETAEVNTLVVAASVLNSIPLTIEAGRSTDSWISTVCTDCTMGLIELAAPLTNFDFLSVSSSAQGIFSIC